MGSNKSKHRVAHNIEKNGMSFMGIENTGKSTFARQIAQTRGTYSESTDNRSLLYSLFGCTDALITTVEKLNLHWSTPTAQTAILNVRKSLQDGTWYSLNKIPQELVACFISIWTDSIVMQVLRNAHSTPEFRLNADAYYYATHIQTLITRSRSNGQRSRRV
jgi:hypothetical protein